MEVVKALRLDAVILDYCMPGPNGLEVAVQIKKIQPNMAVILFSAAYDVCPSGQLDAFVSKGEDVRALLTTLQALLAEGSSARPVRKFPRYSAPLPLTVSVSRYGQIRRLTGTCTDVAEGGIGARIEGELTPGESVFIQIDSPVGPSIEQRASVRYRDAESKYGLQFRDFAPIKQANMRCLCSYLALTEGA